MSLVPSSRANLLPVFTSNQADKLVDTFPIQGGQFNGLYLDQGPSSTLTGNVRLGVDVGENLVKATVAFDLGNPPVPINPITSAGENTFAGKEAGREARYASDCAFFGARTGRDNTDAYYNNGFGHYALGFNILGWKNSAFGTFTMQGQQGLTNVQECSAFGFRALNQVVAAQRCCAVGGDSQLLNENGVDNSSFGAVSLYNCTGDGNSGFGSASGYDVTTGDNNSFLGEQSGRGIVTGSNNTILGANTTLTDVSNYIVLAIGDGAIKAQWNGSAWSFTGGASGSFTTTDGKTVTVAGGLVTSIV